MAGSVQAGRTSRTTLVLAVLVCLQVAVPIVATLQGVPRKFGFHMFTGYEPFEVQVLDVSGTRLDVDLSDWVVVPREDVRWAPRLAPAICADTPGAVTVLVTQWGSEEAHTC